VANLARHHTRPFHAIENIDLPFMILFFVLTGASLQTGMLIKIGLVGIGYLVLRILGRFVGAWVGGTAAQAEPLFRLWIGIALVAAQRRPDLGETILTVVIASTVLFEIAGPILTRQALIGMGEILKS
jgi:Kef-type K+ transport system membrane component KefB